MNLRQFIHNARRPVTATPPAAATPAKARRGGRPRTVVAKTAPKAVKRQELWYAKQLLSLVNACHEQVKSQLYPAVQSAAEALATVDRLTRDGARPRWTGEAENILAGLSKTFGRLQEQAKRLASVQTLAVSKETDAQIIAAARSAVGVNLAPAFGLGGVAKQIQAGVAANVAFITSIPEHYLERVGQTVRENLEAGRRWEDIVPALEHDYGVTKSRAQLIARDQTSKLNASFNQARQQQIGIRKYRWSTSLDERVRPSHADKEGQEFDWDSPPPDTGHPGDDVQCRCVALAVFELD